MLNYVNQGNATASKLVNLFYCVSDVEHIAMIKDEKIFAETKGRNIMSELVTIYFFLLHVR